VTNAPSADELRRVLTAASEAGVVLVGGQALSLWCTSLLPVAHDDLGPVTSHDVDVLGNQDAAIRCAALLGGLVRLPSPDDFETVTAGVVIYRGDAGEERVLDVLLAVAGLAPDDVLDSAIEVEIEGVPLRVMHPLHCLISRFVNVRSLGRRDPHGLAQARASVLCVAALSEQLVQSGRPEDVLDIYERVYSFAREQTARSVYAHHEISAFDCVIPFAALPEVFLERRYPVMSAHVREREHRSRGALLRAQAIEAKKADARNT
jgi:hypothetical protein